MPGALPDEQLVQLSSLVGLLDQHSFSRPSGPSHAYEILFYKFSDGWHTVAAKDETLIGTRLVAIEGTPVEQVEAALRPLVPYDNESGFLDSVEGLISMGAYLHGLGIVGDPTSATYTLERPDGTSVDATIGSVDEPTWEQELGIVGDLVGTAPGAVKRRTEPVWTRIDKKHKTFLLAFNDYVDGTLPPAILELRTALTDGVVDRVVVDARYLRGGNGSIARPLIDELTLDQRLQGPGALTMLIGRENVSAGTLFASAVDHGSNVTLVGEETPARAANFLCDCYDFTLKHFPFTVSVPTYQNDNGDTRDSIPPDVPMALSSADFFAGKDPVLDAAMAGKLPTS